MRKIIVLTIFLLLVPVIALAEANLSWDYVSEDYDRTDGYTVYFTDGSSDYTKTFYKEDIVLDETNNRVLYESIESKLNLHPGIEYTFQLTRFNDTQESDKSNTVAYTRPAHSPPTDQLPDPVTSEPSGVNSLGVE